MKKKSGLRSSLLAVTLFPIIFFGILIVVYCSNQLRLSIHHEVELGLKNQAQTALYLYEKQFPGEYHLDAETSELCKGGKKVDAASEIFEELKKISGTDITVFYKDIRVVTTIRDEKNKPIVGTKALTKIKKEVLEEKVERFYANTTINNEDYFSYYCPIYDSSNNCVGMVFAGKSSKYVQGLVLKGIIPIISIILFAIMAMVFIMRHYSNKLSKALQAIRNFLSKVEMGDFGATLGEGVILRKDELGQIGKSAVQMQASLRELVEKDPLTGLYNRHYGEFWVKQAMAEAEEHGLRFFVALADIDFFKKFNDQYGHDCGDLVLREVSRILEGSMKRRGYASRWGGEEFLLVFQENSMKLAEECVNEIADRVREHTIHYEGQELKVTITMGMVEGDRKLPIDEIIKVADQALYEGKGNGRNQVVCRMKELNLQF
nr:diguanylate cyclase [Eubacterium sp.]